MYNIPYHGERDLSKLSFLVTGGAGFIGSNLAAYLLKFGAGKVRIMDNFSTGSVYNLHDFSLYSSFELIEGDITSLEDCNKAVKGIDIILHEATSGAGKSPSGASVTINEAKIKGLNLLIAANIAGVKRIVDGASSFIYGGSQRPSSLEDELGNAFSSYAISKYVNELYTDIISGRFGTEYIGLRYFNVFGPGRNHDAPVISEFISSLMAHKPPVINADSRNPKVFTYIENVVQANIIAALSEKSIRMNQIYNVTYGDHTSINEMALMLKDILASVDPEIADIDFVNRPAISGTTQVSSAAIAKAENLHGYYPYFSVKDGLVETVKAYLEEDRSSEVLN
jgi:UDP-N-acetylglucosamine/UDP-N-acetylgalactosamine 4-epimerase